MPVRAVTEPFVDADDIAGVAVAALTEEHHGGELYELTGPRLLGFADAVREIASAAGRSIRFDEVDMGSYAGFLAEAGVTDDEISLLRHLFTEVLDGRNSAVTDGVRRALGRPPRDFSAFARDAHATGRWETLGRESA